MWGHRHKLLLCEERGGVVFYSAVHEDFWNDLFEMKLYIWYDSVALYDAVSRHGQARSCISNAMM